jgi:hypothetical protein
MLKGTYCSLLFFLAFSSAGFAQQELFGTIIRKGSKDILIGVNIANLSQKKYNTSDWGGNYKIPVMPGDTLVFTSAGYLPDTLVAVSWMFSERYLVFLAPNVVALPSVQIDETGNYRADSLERRDEYRALLDKVHPVVLVNEKRPGDDPGFSFSPFGYFSKTEKEKRKLKKRLKAEEEEYYVDSKFSPVRVTQFTGLKGDSLQIFMTRYRPTYKFCRGASSQDIFFYINDKLILFRGRDLLRGNIYAPDSPKK